MALDLFRNLKDLRIGPWEVKLPEAQASKGIHSPSGRTLHQLAVSMATSFYLDQLHQGLA